MRHLCLAMGEKGHPINSRLTTKRASTPFCPALSERGTHVADPLPQRRQSVSTQGGTLSCSAIDVRGTHQFLLREASRVSENKFGLSRLVIHAMAWFCRSTCKTEVMVVKYVQEISINNLQRCFWCMVTRFATAFFGEHERMIDHKALSGCRSLGFGKNTGKSDSRLIQP